MGNEWSPEQAPIEEQVLVPVTPRAIHTIKESFEAAPGTILYPADKTLGYMVLRAVEKPLSNCREHQEPPTTPKTETITTFSLTEKKTLMEQ